MTISESITLELFNMKKKNNWSDETFLKSIANLGIQRKEVAGFFDLQVFHGEMKPIDHLPGETLKRIRDFVKQFSLNKTAQLELGKCCALISQLKNNV